jgi:hypothetical protein
VPLVVLQGDKNELMTAASQGGVSRNQGRATTHQRERIVTLNQGRDTRYTEHIKARYSIRQPKKDLYLRGKLSFLTPEYIDCCSPLKTYRCRPPLMKPHSLKAGSLNDMQNKLAMTRGLLSDIPRFSMSLTQGKRHTMLPLGRRCFSILWSTHGCL